MIDLGNGIRGVPGKRSLDPSASLKQRWLDLCFLHSCVDARQVEGIVPSGLTLELFTDGCGETKAWIGLIAFRLEATRLPGLPPFPFWGAFAELNVRTYVRDPEGRPAVLFLSLDSPYRAVNMAARQAFGVPYRWADTGLEWRDDTIAFYSRARDGSAATTEILVTPSGRAMPASSGSLEAFLVERYVYYAALGGKLWSGSVRHEPYRLESLELKELRTNHARAVGLPWGEVSHACFCRGVDSEFFRPQRVRQLPLRPVAPC